MKQWFTLNVPHHNKQPQGDGNEQQYYTNRSVIEYSSTFSTQSGDTVEEVWFEVIAAGGSGVAASPVSAASPQVAAIGDGIGISLASLRRFWAVAARWNSSRAPFGPRNRSRSSFRMRLRWANSISTFFRWRREVW